MQIFYTVQPGDTLYNIATRFGIPLASLVAANNLSAPYLIYPGDQLSMPPGVSTYVVKMGDTLYSISNNYRIPLRELIRFNRVDEPYFITPGMVLNIPRGVPYYTVRHNDTLYKIAAKYNVLQNGQPQPNLIIQANPGLTPEIIPGMDLQIPFGLPSSTGRLATLLSDELNNYILIYDPSSGDEEFLIVDNAGESSRIFYSPDNQKIAYINEVGTISIVDISKGTVSQIDQIPLPAFVDWSADSSSVIYSTGEVIRIYNILNHNYSDINRNGASYVQWFPNQNQILYEVKDTSGLSQIYHNSIDGNNETLLTENLNGPFNEVSLSPDGKYVLYTSPGASISEIYILELSSAVLYKIPSGPEAKNFYPAWSPDSSKIAFSSTFFSNGRYYSLIRVSNIYGTDVRTLAVSSCYATPVIWSKDSQRMAYFSGCRENHPPVEIWIIDINKPVPINVLSGFLFYHLSFDS